MLNAAPWPSGPPFDTHLSLIPTAVGIGQLRLRRWAAVHQIRKEQAGSSVHEPRSGRRSTPRREGNRGVLQARMAPSGDGPARRPLPWPLVVVRVRKR